MDEKYKLSDGHNLPNVLSKWWPIVKKDLQTIFQFANKHIAGESDRHKAEDVDFDQTTVKAALNTETETRAQADSDILAEVRSLNLKNGIGEGSLRSVNSANPTGTNAVQLGDNSQASGNASFAIGKWAKAKKAYSLATNKSTIAGSEAQSARGKYNIEDADDVYADIVGNGNSDTDRSNAYTLDWNGNGWFAGNITIGADKEEVATKVDGAVPIEQGGMGATTVEGALKNLGLDSLGDTIIDLGDIDVSAEDGSGRVADLDLNTLFTDIHTDGIYKFGLSADDFYVSSYLIVGKVFGEVSGGVYFNETTTWQLLFNPNNTLDVLYRLYNSDNDTHMYQWTQFKRLFPTIAEHDALETRVSQKLDKDTIVTETANNTLLLQENQDARLGETSSLVLSMPESIGDWYRSTFSFQSGESATSLVYGYTPLDWKGDDVTSDGRFVPEPFSTYEVDVKNLGVNGVRARVDKIAGYSSVDVEGTVLALPSSAGKALRDYKIYGNSVQDGEPSEETPVSIQSVGNYNEKTGKYDVPIVVSGKNLLNPTMFTLGKTLAWGAFYDTEFWTNDCIYSMMVSIPIKPNNQYSFTNENTERYWVDRIVEVLPNGNGCRDHSLYTSESKNYKCYSFTTREDAVALMFRVRSVDGSGLTQADIEALRVMLLEGTYTEDAMPDYEPYRAPVTTTISLDEPLRKIGDVADYIDYTRDAVMRQVEVLDDTGTLPLEESYAAAESPSMERIYWSDGRRFLPTIDTNLYDNVITIGTTVQPSNVKVTYFKKGR